MPTSAPSSRLADPARLAALARTGLLDAPPDDCFDRLTRMAVTLLGVPTSLVTLVDVERQFFLSQVGVQEPWSSLRGTPLSHSFCQHVVQRGPLAIADARRHPLVADSPAVAELGVRAYAGVPLTSSDGQSLGAFCAIDARARDWSAHDMATLRDLAAMAATETALREALERAELRSRTDPLTGLWNRRHLAETLHQALGEGPDTGLVFLDLDCFKAVNDEHGHATGDQVLVAVARAVGAAAPDATVGRWGGEEFAIVTRAASDEALQRLAEAVRQAVASAELHLPGGRRLSVTASLGAARGERGLRDDVLIERADRALYAAKRRGRDRTVLHAELRARDLAPEQPPAVQVAQALARAAAVREGSPDLHAQHVADLAGAVATQLGLSLGVRLRCELAGWLHDVGKLAVPEAILGKRGPLDDEEWRVMRTHPLIGERLIEDVNLVAAAAPGVRHHHERWDGGGYPDGLAGAEIPIEARIVAACDAFSAMTTDRLYRRARDWADAMAELSRSAGTHLDPDVVVALRTVIGGCGAARIAA